MTWVQTRSGKAVELFDTKADTIDFGDIAHALSQICRFNGHTKEHYSVAQHSVHVADLLPENLKIYGLLHDAHEAYLGDINTMVKRALKHHSPSATGALKQIELDLDLAIYKKAGVPYPDTKTRGEVKRADEMMLMTERRDLMSKPPMSWGAFEQVPLAPFRVAPWSATNANRIFEIELREQISVVQRLSAQELAAS